MSLVPPGPDWRARLRTALGGDADPDVVEELAQHAEASYAAERAEGVSSEEASRNVGEQLEVWSRERRFLGPRRRRPPLVEPASTASGRILGMAHDLRHAWRNLRRQPGHSALVVATMAVGIGATTVLFSVVYGVVLKPLPWPGADRLVRLSESREGETRSWPWMFTNRSYLALSDPSGTMEGVAAWRVASATLSQVDDPERVLCASVTPSLFPLLDARALLGETFRLDATAEDRVLLLSEELWKQRFAGDPHVLGQVVRLDGEAYRVAGVMPRGFAFPGPETRAWTPLSVSPVENEEGRPHLSLFSALARLRPGASPGQAAAEATARIAAAPDAPLTAQAVFGSQGPARVAAAPLLASWTDRVAPALWLLLAAVGLLLATATANVAALQLARATARRRELAVRCALGAGTRRIARLLLAESVLLGVVGGLGGLALAAAAEHALPVVLPAGFPRLDDVGLDVRVAGFAALLAMATGIAFGLLPALFAGRLNLAEAIAEDGAGSLGAGRSVATRVRSVILAGQMAVACLLALGALQLGRSFLAQLTADRGYTTANLLVMELPLPDSLFTAERRASLMASLLERVRGLGGVEEAAFTNILPLSASEALAAFELPGLRAGDEPRTIVSTLRTISAGYFEALGRRLVEGRVLAAGDGASSPAVVVVNRTFARRYLGPRPVGTLLPLGFEDRPDWEVVGVVDDVLPRRPQDPPQPEMFVASAQRRGGLGSSVVSVLVRTRRPADETLIRTLRAILREQHPALVPESITTMEDLVRGSLAQPRLNSVVLGVFAACALAIAGVGLFGLLSYSVALRTREIGVRMALGARPGDVIGWVAGHGLKLTGAGLVLGLAASLALGRLIEGELYGIRAHDPGGVVAVCAVLGVIAVLATALPARRAARIDPQHALRQG